MKQRGNHYLQHSEQEQLASFNTSRRKLLKAGLSWAVAANLPATALAESPRQPTAPAPKATTPTYVPGSAKRLCQLTGDTDPTDLPHLNRTAAWGISGTDMGCPVEFKGRLYLFFGDVPTTTPVDIDPICYTTDTNIVDGNLQLSCITQRSGQFSPLTIDGHTLGTNETATGAFAYRNRLYVFVVRGNSKPYSTLISTADPAKNTDFTPHFEVSDPQGRFWQIAPWVIRNADWPGLPSRSGDGLLLWGQSGRSVYLAWAPLPSGLKSPSDLRFYASGGSWSPDQAAAVPVFSTNGVTQLSVTWSPGPQQWVCLYTRASTANPDDSIVARLGQTPWAWSDEVPIFNPDREMAWGRYMHKRGEDPLNAFPPPRSPTLPGYAYSPFLLNRYTTWNAPRRTLLLTYLMATFVPYQVMLMQATLQLT